jgi:catechol 2,3-dioxygenase-like lactoylglutathione lyase family enzyme
MYDHIGLKVKTVEASVRFYEQALKPLGHVVASRDASGAGYRAGGGAGAVAVCGEAARRVGNPCRLPGDQPGGGGCFPPGGVESRRS